MLKGGAAAIQTDPVNGLNVYLVGFHPLKDDPEHQMEAHHFCRQVNEDFAQCVLFDGNTASANLNGVEFIISEKLFATLPEQERQYWHPHNAEILSGQLVAPGIPETAEKELMRSKMNSYGTTWHVWMSDSGDKLPLGPPMLAWSFNHDGEAKLGLVESRDRQMSIDTAKKRQERQDLVQIAKPQSGVYDLKGKFARSTQPIALIGVVLGAFASPWFLILPALVAAFLLQHAVQGWCPPVPILRRLGFRTHVEIGHERYALKALRGDFRQIGEVDSTRPHDSAARLSPPSGVDRFALNDSGCFPVAACNRCRLPAPGEARFPRLGEVR